MSKEAKQATTVMLFFGFVMSMLLQCSYSVYQVCIAVMAIVRGLLCCLSHGFDDSWVCTCTHMDPLSQVTHVDFGMSDDICSYLILRVVSNPEGWQQLRTITHT